MTIFEHLEELRKRVMYALAYWILCTCVVGFYADGLMGLLLRPFMQALERSHQDPVMIYTEPTASFAVVFKIVMILGAFLASPFIFWEAWGFVASGLYGRERRAVLVAAPVSFLLFCCGVLFFHVWVLTPALDFLYAYGRDFFPDRPDWRVVQMPNVPDQVSFYLWMSFSMGLVFQLPLVMVLLNRLGIVEAKSFAKYQRHFILGATLAAAIITPTGDAVTLTLFMIPILALFYAGLGAVYLRERSARKRRPEAA
jgi:sec-independent protein translocase protein TatC